MTHQLKACWRIPGGFTVECYCGYKAPAKPSQVKALERFDKHLLESGVRK